MKRVVERCPNCGVEYDAPQGGTCEVCGTALRYWCRAHSRAIGWLDSPECPSCAAEAAARAPRTVPPRAPTRTPPPEPPPRVPPRPPAPAPTPAPARPSWRTRVTTRRPPPPPEWKGEPAPPPEPAPRRAPREIIVREGKKDRSPHLPTGASVAARLFSAVLAVIRNVIGWGVIGILLAAAVAYYENADIFWFAMFGAMVGGGIGLLFGIILGLRVLFAEPPRRER